MAKAKGKKKVANKAVKKAPGKKPPAAKKHAAPKKTRPVKKSKATKKSAKPQLELITSEAVSLEPKRKRALPRIEIKKNELNSIRKNLLELRARISASMKRAQSFPDTPDVGDEADQAGLNIERELQFELSDNERSTLDQIEGALRKMEKGTYGNCELCRLPIEKLRIKALPFARYCIQCQNTSEKAAVTLL